MVVGVVEVLGNLGWLELPPTLGAVSHQSEEFMAEARAWAFGVEGVVASSWSK